MADAFAKQKTLETEKTEKNQPSIAQNTIQSFIKTHESSSSCLHESFYHFLLQNADPSFR